MESLNGIFEFSLKKEIKLRGNFENKNWPKVAVVVKRLTHY